eukprot:2674657-Alexandrium_andersonii.AAC.1
MVGMGDAISKFGDVIVGEGMSAWKATLARHLWETGSETLLPGDSASLELLEKIAKHEAPPDSMQHLLASLGRPGEAA